MSTNESKPLRRSIEVEYWVVDERGRLVGSGDLIQASPGVEREFVEPLIEIKTTPCETTAELRTELFERIGHVLQRANEVGKALVPLATPMSDERIQYFSNDRTAIQRQVVGEPFQYVCHCAGTHIHVEQQPGHEIEQVNSLTALDPALALVNSSPYFGGQRIATGARSKLYRWMAYEAFPHQGRLWPYATDTEEWMEWLDRSYEEFTTAAREAGISRSAIETHFEPESTAWIPVKLRDSFTTVEWRSPDTALPSQVLQLADDIVGLLERLGDADLRIDGVHGRVTEDTLVLPEFNAVCDYVTAAIREGLSSERLRSYLARMGFDVESYQPLTDELPKRRITERDVRRLRMTYAEKLRSDVQESQQIIPD